MLVRRLPGDAYPGVCRVLRLHVRQRLAALAYPREIEFVEHLPKTPSGKLQRFILRNQEIAKQQAFDT
ncbi:AMP-binding enzyme [Pseudomonas lurida]|uniref:AMP-binding enzyme n=1 Tax=Pseudomonas lurida TaxID=244566 RepID=UPI000B0D74D7